MDNLPLVSIGLPTYNGASRIKRTIDSLLAQSYRNFELVISDNASEDNTREICETYARQDSRIRYIRQPNNLGMVPNFYDVVANESTGDYFMWTSDDDWWHPEFISTLKKVLDYNKSYGVAMGSLGLVYEDGVKAGQISFDDKIGSLTYGQVFNAIINKKPPLHFFIYGLFRMEVIRKLHWQSTPLVVGPDKVLMSEAALFTRFYSISSELLVRTIHRASATESQRWEGDPYQSTFSAYFSTLITWCKRLYQSPNIPFFRKVFMLPRKTFFLFWMYRKHLLHEFWPSGFNFLKRVVRYKP